MNLPPLPPLPTMLMDEGSAHSVRVVPADAARTYAEQYGRLCAEAPAAELDRLRARVAELEVDACRYQWLRANYFRIQTPGIDLRGVRDFGDKLEAEALDKEIDDMRATIDTARKAKP